MARTIRRIIPPTTTQIEKMNRMIPRTAVPIITDGAAVVAVRLLAALFIVSAANISAITCDNLSVSSSTSSIRAATIASTARTNAATIGMNIIVPTVAVVAPNRACLAARPGEPLIDPEISCHIASKSVIGIAIPNRRPAHS